MGVDDVTSGKTGRRRHCWEPKGIMVSTRKEIVDLVITTPGPLYLRRGLEARPEGVWGWVRKRRCVAHALVATREATVVHVYNSAMISKRVHFVQREARGSLGHSVPGLLRK